MYIKINKMIPRLQQCFSMSSPLSHRLKTKTYNLQFVLSIQMRNCHFISIHKTNLFSIFVLQSFNDVANSDVLQAVPLREIEGEFYKICLHQCSLIFEDAKQRLRALRSEGFNRNYSLPSFQFQSQFFAKEIEKEPMKAEKRCNEIEPLLDGVCIIVNERVVKMTFDVRVKTFHQNKLESQSIIHILNSK